MAGALKTFEDAENYCQSFISPDHAPKTRTLRRITHLMQVLGNPQKHLHVIHVTGSYGKSSTAYMIASLLEQKGLTVGLHTKPHLQSITERISINRILIPKDVFVGYVNKIKLVVDTMDEQPTYFELLVAIMLLYFYESHVDVAVIEVGRGGRLDATNICVGNMLVITNIFLVHTDILGNTKEKILKEKMGLMKPHTNIISGVTQQPLQTSMRRLAKPFQTTIHFSNTDRIKNISIPFGGSVQRTNAALALLAATTYTDLTDTHINAGFSSMKFPGRFEVQPVGTNTIIMDSAHDEEKMRLLLQDIQLNYPKQKMTVILRKKKTEEVHAFTTILQPIAHRFLFVSLEQKEKNQCMTVPEVIRYIKKQTNTLFLVTSSIHLIGTIRAGLSIPYRLK